MAGLPPSPSHPGAGDKGPIGAAGRAGRTHLVAASSLLASGGPTHANGVQSIPLSNPKRDLDRSISAVDLDVVAVDPPRRGYIWDKGKGGPEVAQKLSVTYACDYDQREIPQGQHRLRRFSIDGRDYEIDLCLKHSERFDEAVSRYASQARKASTRPVRTKRRTAAHRQHSAQVRAWAKANGFAVSERGRIPSDVVTRYESTHA